MFLAMTKLVIGKISDYEEGKLIHVTAGGKEIVTTKIGDRYYAMNNICNHAGAELHEGKLEGNNLICPWHGAKWDVTNGNLAWFPQKLEPEESYNVIVENDVVLLEL